MRRLPGLSAAVLVTGIALTVSGCGSSHLTPHAPTSAADRPLPDLTDPDGATVTLTAPETELLFGDEATVATTGQGGQLLVWTITVTPSAAVPGKDTGGNAGSDRLLCRFATLTFLGATGADGGDGNGTDRSDRLGSVRSTDLEKTLPPQLSSAIEDGSDAPAPDDGDADPDAVCGVPETERLPVAESDLAIGGTYTQAIPAVVPGTPSDGNPTPVGVRFDYLPGIPGMPGTTRYPSSVYWGEE